MSQLEGHTKKWSYFNRNGDHNGEREMAIMEPCNYASNIAYYHSSLITSHVASLRICKYPKFCVKSSLSKVPRLKFNADNVTQQALKRGFITLTAGSAFMHGTHTDLGAYYDNNLIGVIAYTSWRSLLNELGGSNSTVLNCLSTNKTCISAPELSEKFAFFSRE